jgi:hypothetical protein
VPKLGWCLALLLAVRALAFTPSEPARGQERRTDAGEQMLNAACLTCHDHRHVDTQALDEAGWTKVVKAEVARGAKLKDDEVPVLVDFLVRYHGPLPDGPGKELVLNICTQCHDLQRVRRTRLSPEGWLGVLETMLNEGAPLSEKDLPDVLRYLARNFRPER